MNGDHNNTNGYFYVLFHKRAHSHFIKNGVNSVHDATSFAKVYGKKKHYTLYIIIIHIIIIIIIIYYNYTLYKQQAALSKQAL